MNLAELGQAPQAIGIPAELVALGGHAEQSWCVEQAPDGGW